MMQRIFWILALAGTLAATAAAAVVTEDWSKQFSTALRLGDCELALQILSDARRTRAEGAEYTLGVLYDEGLCLDQDVEAARTIFERLAAADKLAALVRLAGMYARGVITPSYPGEAEAVLKRMALEFVVMQRPVRSSLIGISLYPDAVPAGLMAELDWLAEVEDGDPQALYELARRVLVGDGIPQHTQAARIWLMDAGESGIAAAYYDVGMDMLTEPEGSFDFRGGLHYLSRAGIAGHLPAQIEIARHFAEGDGTMQRDYAAYQWLLEARHNGGEVSTQLRAVGSRLSSIEREAAQDDFKTALSPPFPSPLIDQAEATEAVPFANERHQLVPTFFQFIERPLLPLK